MTPVSLSLSVPFPVTVTSINFKEGDNVERHALLLKFKYWDYQDDPNSKDENPQKIRVERIGTLESPVEGRVASVDIHVNEEVAHSGMELFQIDEPCAHTVQYGGLCALCGKSVEDEKDYTGFSYEDRATIAMSHDNTGLRISLEEATKIEQTATSRLAEARKLILVVDLDQTVIHATVDPTVGEWQQDRSNPNYPFVADVRSFFLEEEEPQAPPGWTGPRPGPTKCWYYVKLRPGLETFLKNISKLYELHIYTMATRNYALAISNIIDPTGEYFGDRILSRDESGLLTHKNLKRLFPVDQSMVAIIDDRGDVWQWEANLVKVVPYDFFVGIGDINLSFLPKKNGQLLGPSKKRKAIARLEAVAEAEAEAGQDNETDLEPTEKTIKPDGTTGSDTYETAETQDGNSPSDSESRSPSPSSGVESVPSSPVDRILLLGGGENNQDLLVEQLKIRSKMVEQQQHDRPLAKLQHDLDKVTHSDHEGALSDSDGKEDEENDHLLYDDDKELVYLETALEKFHTEYYRLLGLFNKNQTLERPDLTHIIPRLKKQCLQGLVVLFSGILPLGMNVDDADIVIWCRQFGIKVVTEVYPEVTHVVCRDPNALLMKTGLTLKVRVAKRTLPEVKVVSPDWLFACLSQWKIVSSDEYEISLPDSDWYVSETDVKKYQNAFDAQLKRLNGPPKTASMSGRSNSLGSIEEYDLNEASDEVDDFLAGISDDDDSNDDEDDDDDEDMDGNSATNSNGMLFVKTLYGAKKRKADDDSLSEEADDEDTSRIASSHTKKAKIDDGDGKDLDDLEQELLDELDHLSD
ncbi:hypothetical protein PUMCH_003619 [Australozyma saopauloensis]|uniref:RNA polymerase II subunit A C-terminal domain phosphatase n=1 Tax=Australozyma saopauloensis TaxID=291208 RepID=A0AAX4HCM7_9ASCO|nr:hypothetical protein PUMCH_003619 [[Candida] saopauloensis]